MEYLSLWVMKPSVEVSSTFCKVCVTTIGILEDGNSPAYCRETYNMSL